MFQGDQNREQDWLWEAMASRLALNLGAQVPICWGIFNVTPNMSLP